MKRELTPQEREVLSRAATIGNLERAGRPEYDGRKATAAATQASWQAWLDRADGDPVKAARLRKAALLRGRMNKKG